LPVVQAYCQWCKPITSGASLLPVVQAYCQWCKPTASGASLLPVCGSQPTHRTLGHGHRWRGSRGG
ncbi:unnamed protein product, partial [Closterium sp. Naga37s-1]